MNRMLQARAVCLSLLVLATACGPAQGQEPDAAPADPAQTKTPSEFTRFVKVDDGGHLDTAITTYRNQDGVEVTLFGAVHIADGGHYRTLQERFRAHDALLYELVGPENYRPTPGESRGGFVSLLQRMLKTGLELEFQLDGIDYRQDNFVHADLTPKEFAAMQQEKGESLLGLMWQSMVREAKRAREAGESGGGLGDVDLVAAFRNNEGRHTLRMLFASQLQDVERIAAGFGDGDKGSVLVEGRNERCLEVLQREIKAGRRQLGIYYGAAHLPHLEQRLVADLGFRKVRQEWLVAWDCTRRPDKATDEPAQPGAPRPDKSGRGPDKR